MIYVYTNQKDKRASKMGNFFFPLSVHDLPLKINMEPQQEDCKTSFLLQMTFFCTVRVSFRRWIGQ